MKKSDIERQLKKDLQAAAPSDFDAVWKKCRHDLPEKETEEEHEKEAEPKFNVTHYDK